MQRGSQFTNGNRNTTRTEIVTTFNEFTDRAIAEKTLELSLGWSIALLNLGRIF